VPDHPVAKALKGKLGELLIAERLVDRLLGKNVVQHFGEQDQSVDLARRRLDNRPLFLHRRLGFDDAHVAGRRDTHAGGIAALHGDGGLESGAFPDAVRQAVVDHEHEVSPFRGKRLAAARLAGLGSAPDALAASAAAVNEWGRCHDVKNLFVVDGSIWVTSGGVNPTSTIQALALYIADSIKKRLATLFD